MSEKKEEIVLYVPIHSGLGQVEHTAALMLEYKSKLFVYGWNPAGRKVVNFYSNDYWKNIEEILDFSVENLVESLLSERSKGRKVVFLLTSSINYAFGGSQLTFFNKILKDIFPDVIKDVFSVGHCLFGCQSCGVREHSVPIYFTRFYKNLLPVSREKVREIVNSQKLTTGRNISILLCPSVGLFSYLSSPPVLQTLIQAQKTLGNLFFMVKLHDFCYVEGHPLSSLSQIEKEGARILRENFPVVDESQPNVLPLLSEFDIIISDLDSSVTFEALYFKGKPILAYHHPEQDLTVHSDQYLELLNLFSVPEELSALLVKISKDVNSFPRKDGTFYFKQIYGEVDGREVERIAETRKWKESLGNPEIKEKTPNRELIEKKVEEAMERGEFSVPVTASDYLALSIQVPEHVLEFDKFVRLHLPQLETMGLPTHYWKALHNQLKNETFDAGNFVEIDYDEVVERFQLRSKEDIKTSDDSGLFLVDHAWSTEYSTARSELQVHPVLIERLAAMMNIGVDFYEEPEGNNPPIRDWVSAADAVWNEMWKYWNTYKIGERQTWYFMDEVGSAIGHSDEPNYKCMPFYYAEKGISFSIMWPIKDVEKGESINRDFYPNPTQNELERRSHLEAWFPQDEGLFTASIRLFDEKYENFPQTPSADPTAFSLKTSRDRYLVYTDVEGVAENLTLKSNFILTDNRNSADILWLADEFKTFGMLGTNQIVNQFPGESSLVFKHQLPATVYNAHGLVDWLPLTFNMETQLAEFIGEFKKREGEVRSNLWIVKPWNMARSLDMIISDNLSCLIRATETGPKVVCKYIENPILYEGRKFDLRYIVLLKSIEPLELYVYNMFWIRLANIPFDLSNFEEYERHFTVMNYSAHKLTQLHYKDFIANMEKQNPGLEWNQVQTRINKAFRRLFESASLSEPPYGFAPTNQARAMYGIDVMLDEGFQPKILEVNFNADTKRACQYDPQYYNNVFSTLFLNEGEGATTASGAVTKI